MIFGPILRRLFSRATILGISPIFFLIVCRASCIKRKAINTTNTTSVSTQVASQHRAVWWETLHPDLRTSNPWDSIIQFEQELNSATEKIAQCEPSLRLTPDLDFCREPLPLRVHVPVFQLWCQPIKKKEKCWYFSLPGPYSLLWPVNFWGFFLGGKTNSGSLTFRTIFQRGGNPTSDPKGARVDFVFQ